VALHGSFSFNDKSFENEGSASEHDELDRRHFPVVLQVHLCCYSLYNDTIYILLDPLDQSALIAFEDLTTTGHDGQGLGDQRGVMALTSRFFH
jgi:hypothetical protein